MFRSQLSVVITSRLSSVVVVAHGFTAGGMISALLPLPVHIVGRHHNAARVFGGGAVNQQGMPCAGEKIEQHRWGVVPGYVYELPPPQTVRHTKRRRCCGSYVALLGFALYSSVSGPPSASLRTT